MEQASCGGLSEAIAINDQSLNKHPVVDVVNHAIDEWRRRLSACVDAEGRHFEHYL